MRKQKDIINNRLARIAAAQPAPSIEGASPFASKPRRNRPQRREERIKTFKPGKVFFGRNLSTRCVVNDLTTHGAHISLDHDEILPDKIVLRFDQSLKTYQARIAWRGEREYGLCFL